MKTTTRKHPLKCAIFGTGWWSAYQIPAWLALDGVELVAVYNRTRAKAEVAANRFGISSVYDNPEELLENEQLDFVDIITEVPAHAPLVKLAAKHRLPVVCQKPMGPNFETCRSMVEACDEAGVPLFINENYRWKPQIRLLKKLLDEGLIGRPCRADLQFSTGGAAQLESQPFLKSLRHYALFDLGSHLFDVARFLFGEPDRIYCQAKRSIDTIAGDDLFSAILTYKNLTCTCQCVDYSAATIFIEGTDGALEWRSDDSLFHHTRNELRPLSYQTQVEPAAIRATELAAISPDSAQSIINCQKNILDALKGGIAAETCGADNLETMKLLFAATRSALSGESVVLAP